ncbi:Proline-rich protein [Corchorus olitorius]|uniref:Proline-rich protein n=1 Tax=Corchorus olitorius TaxID=93759 RepID=A0A1R3HHC5_9ROSI|nr:Proline-rich protein [Corchorus olitorius]
MQSCQWRSPNMKSAILNLSSSGPVKKAIGKGCIADKDVNLECKGPPAWIVLIELWLLVGQVLLMVYFAEIAVIAADIPEDLQCCRCYKKVKKVLSKFPLEMLLVYCLLAALLTTTRIKVFDYGDFEFGLTSWDFLIDAK